jgi:hypothetical protein
MIYGARNKTFPLAGPCCAVLLSAPPLKNQRKRQSREVRNEEPTQCIEARSAVLRALEARAKGIKGDESPMIDAAATIVVSLVEFWSKAALTVQQIKAARMLLGWHQTELARRAGLSSVTVKRLERVSELKVPEAVVAKMVQALKDAGINSCMAMPLAFAKGQIVRPSNGHLRRPASMTAALVHLLDSRTLNSLKTQIIEPNLSG